MNLFYPNSKLQSTTVETSRQELREASYITSKSREKKCTRGECSLAFHLGVAQGPALKGVPPPVGWILLHQLTNAIPHRPSHSLSQYSQPLTDILPQMILNCVKWTIKSVTGVGDEAGRDSDSSAHILRHTLKPPR